MLEDFIVLRRDEIIARARARVALRLSPKPTEREITQGVPVFLDQLGDALRRSHSTNVTDHNEITRSATVHGQELLRMGVTIAHVVHDYGDLCQVITGLALEHSAPISAEEFQTLNLCLDDAIAGAVTEFARQRERAVAAEGTERLGMLAHELRNMLSTATLAFESIRNGSVSSSGSTGALLGRSLTGLSDLIDRSLADVRLDSGLARRQPLSVAELVEDVEIGASVLAHSRGIQFIVTTVDHSVTIEADKQTVAAAVSNLLTNAFKFTRKKSSVWLTVQATADRVLFEVEDECGGLPPGATEDLFRPFEQRSSDRSGVGLGLSICAKAARTNGGEIRVRDLPGKGCVFTLDLPRAPTPPLQLVG